MGAREIALTREVFWQNVMRELLTSLSVLASQQASRAAAAAGKSLADASQAGRPATGPSTGARGGSVTERMIGAAVPIGDPILHGENEEEVGDDGGEFEIPANVGAEPGNLFDGRLAVITSLGQRIPIAEVHPVFACGVRGPDGSHLLSSIIECSVFEIRTPGGEVYTLPIHEIKAFHALTPELVEELGKALGVQKGEDDSQPFGFAAFTSLARNQGALSEVPQVEREWQGE
jgi:hypothetical protein